MNMHDQNPKLQSGLGKWGVSVAGPLVVLRGGGLAARGSRRTTVQSGSINVIP